MIHNVEITIISILCLNFIGGCVYDCIRDSDVSTLSLVLL